MTIEVPDDALVIRGSDVHDPANELRMQGQAQVSYDIGEGYALSVFVGYDPAASREALMEAIASVQPVPNSLVCVTTAGTLRAKGFTLEVDEGDLLPAHANVVLGEELSPARVRQFIEAFGPAEPNPARAKWRPA